MIEEKTSEELDILQGVDELNIAEFPLAILSQRPSGNHVSYSNYVTDRKTQLKIKRELTISAPEGSNLPTVFDANVVLGLLQFKDRINDRGYQSFSLRELARVLGLDQSGKTVGRVKKSIELYYDLDLEYKNAWYDAYNKEWRTAKFRLINDLEFSESGDYKIQWSDRFLSNIQQNYLKPLDLDLFRSIKNPIAQTLFRFLDKKFHRNVMVDYTVENLVFNHLGFPRNGRSRISAIKDRLQPAIDILEDKNFIDRDPTRMYRRGKEWRVRFNRIGTLQESNQGELFGTSEMEELKQRMLEQGFSASQAKKYLEEHGFDNVQKCFEIVLWRKYKEVGKIKNFPAYFSTVIEDDPEFPEGYVSEQDRIAKEQARIAKKEEEQRIEDEKKAEADKEIAEMITRVNSFLEGLGEEKAGIFLNKHKLHDKDMGSTMWYVEVEELMDDLGV